MKKYELIEHTADVGIKAYGNSVSEAFENAAKGMFDIITDKSKIESIGQYDIQLESPDLEQLLVDWLSELLFLNSAKNLVFGSFEVKYSHLLSKFPGADVFAADTKVLTLFSNSSNNKVLSITIPPSSKTFKIT